MKAPKTASIPVPGRRPGRPPSGVKPLATKPMVAATADKKPLPFPAMKKGGLVPFAKKGAAPAGKGNPFGAAKANPFAKKGK